MGARSVIWHRKAKRWNKAELDRADRMAIEIGCIYCWLEEGHRGPCEHRHHIKEGNVRMGHWFTLPCCNRHHADCHNGTYGHADQIDKWLKVQHALNLSDELPPSKIYKRREVLTEAEVSNGR